MCSGGVFFENAEFLAEIFELLGALLLEPLGQLGFGGSLEDRASKGEAGFPCEDLDADLGESSPDAVAALIHVFLQLRDGAERGQYDLGRAGGHNAETDAQDDDRDGPVHSGDGGDGRVEVLVVRRDRMFEDEGGPDLPLAVAVVDGHDAVVVGIVEAERRVVTFNHHGQFVEQRAQFAETPVDDDLAADVDQIPLPPKVFVFVAGEGADEVAARRNVDDAVGLGVERNDEFLLELLPVPFHAHRDLGVAAVGRNQEAAGGADDAPEDAVLRPVAEFVLEVERLTGRTDILSFRIPEVEILIEIIIT